MWGQLSTTSSNVQKQPNGELLVAVNHNQLRAMASETVDPIDWSHPPPSWAVPLERHVHSINQCNLSWTRTCNRSMRGKNLAYAATQGIKKSTILRYVYFRMNAHIIKYILYIYIYIVHIYTIMCIYVYIYTIIQYNFFLINWFERPLQEQSL